MMGVELLSKPSPDKNQRLVMITAFIMSTTVSTTVSANSDKLANAIFNLCATQPPKHTATNTFDVKINLCLYFSCSCSHSALLDMLELSDDKIHFVTTCLC